MNKQALFWLLTALLLIGIVEAGARLTYRWLYGASAADLTAGTNAALDAGTVLRNRFQGSALQPFYGLIGDWHNLDLNMPPSSLDSRRRAITLGGQDAVVVALFGGSVTADVAGALAGALAKQLADRADREGSAPPVWPILIELAYSGYRQPQQSLAFANMLANGVEFDIVLSLDGVNEVWLPWREHQESGTHPIWPARWSSAVGHSADQRLAAARIMALREEQRALTRLNQGWLRSSAVFGLMARYRLDQIGRLIVARHLDLAATDPKRHNLQEHGPRGAFTRDEVRDVVAAAWYRGALLLAGLAERHGADYYHFLQPNQYVPNAKPLSDEELANAYMPTTIVAEEVRQGYPKLAEYGARLRERGVKFFDLSDIFVEHRETLYVDSCCHLNRRGNELLANHMLRRILDDGQLVGPRHLAAKGNARDRSRYQSVLAGIVNGDFGAPAARSVFDVYRKGRTLVYMKRHCTVDHITAPFFVNFTRNDGSGVVTPRFHFTQHGAFLHGNTCVAIFQLPDFGIEHLRTGQLSAAGEWSVEPDVDELNTLDRATRAAWNDEAVVEKYQAALDLIEAGHFGAPFARSVFDVYHQGRMLVYLKQPCVASDIKDFFFLHITSSSDSGDTKMRNFRFAQHGAMLDGDSGNACVAIAELTDDGVGHMRTGQTNGKRDIWSVGGSLRERA